MSSDTNSTTNSSSSDENADDHGSLWQDLFSGKGGMLLLGIGAFLILCNVVVFSGVDARPSTWLFYLNMRFWSIQFSLFLWTIAIWLTLESIDAVEDYLLTIRIAMGGCVLLFAIAALLNFLNISLQERALWFDAILIIAVCCAIRSVWLLYDYRYLGKDFIDLEEAQWFWGLSGFILAGLAIFGIMHIIPVERSIHAGTDGVATVSLFKSCQDGFQDIIRTGRVSFVLYAFGILLITASITFVYVVGKWLLVLLSRIRGE